MRRATDVVGERGYRTLRRAAGSHRSDLVLRLGAEAGLRPAEMTRVRPADVIEFEGHYLLAVRSDDGVARETYLPGPVEHDVRKFADGAGVDDDEPLLSVSTRRVQMLVREVAERASDDAPRLADVSSRDLRWRFAASLLDDDVPPSVVCALGGWDRLERLAPLIDEPDREAIVSAIDGPDGGTPGRLDRVAAGLAGVSRSLVDAASGADVAAAVCDRLADAPGYRFAWLADRTGDGPTLRAATDVDEAAVDRQLDDYVETFATPLEAGEVRLIRDVDGPVALFPVVRDDVVAGVVGVGATAEPGERERDLLTALGVQVGHAEAAVERKRLLLADTVTELTFECTDDRAFTVGLSGALGCSVALSGVVPVAGQSLLYYLTVDGAAAEPILSHAADDEAVDDARLLEEYRDGALLEVVVAAAPALGIVESGGRIRDLTAADGSATIVAEIPGEAAVRPIVDAVVDAYPETSLTAKRETERPIETDAGVHERLADRLSDRQRTALRAAYHSGYFEWPRGSTAEEVADSLGVSSPTFHNHLRKAQGKVMTAFFGDRPAEPPGSLDG
jgi:predicted DNA binding protein